MRIISSALYTILIDDGVRVGKHQHGSHSNQIMSAYYGCKKVATQL
jgi:hypothetical protein